MTKFRSKADLIPAEELARLEKIPFTNPEGDRRGTAGRCSGCDAELPTEAAFARHFHVPDARYPNLGWCPFKDARKFDLTDIPADIPRP